MSWGDFDQSELYEADKKYYNEIRPARIAEATEILNQLNPREIIFTNCEIPLQIDVILPTGEMCYGRNSRVGGNVTMWVFKEKCNLSKGWPPILWEGEKEADAWQYPQIAEKMVEMINEFNSTKNT